MTYRPWYLRWSKSKPAPESRSQTQPPELERVRAELAKVVAETDERVERVIKRLLDREAKERTS